MLELWVELRLLKLYNKVCRKKWQHLGILLVSSVGMFLWVLDTLMSLSLAMMRYVLMRAIVSLVRLSDLSLKTVSGSWKKGWLRTYLAIAKMVGWASKWNKAVLEAQNYLNFYTLNLSRDMLQICPTLIKMDEDEYSLKHDMLLVDFNLLDAQLALVNQYKTLVDERLLKIKQGRAPKDRV